MATHAGRVVEELNRRYLLDYPEEAAQLIEQMPPDEAAESIMDQPAQVLAPVWRRLVPNVAVELLSRMPDDLVRNLLSELRPMEALRLLGALDEAERERCLGLLDPHIRGELNELMAYPPDTAGHLMDTRVIAFRSSVTAAGALDILRRNPDRVSRSLFLVDDANRLQSLVQIEDLATASPDSALATLARRVTAVVEPLSPIEEVVTLLDRERIADLPVVDIDGGLLGIIAYDQLVQAAHEDTTADIQTMVGASKDERALSSPLFAVRKRLPWMQI
ncbi:MAG: CBS domain-containing protein, partial [Rhodovibrionaceae bacterium]|nr:CBS domain-containing protein [Rhodovibrionaceae bacterium]